MASSESSVLSEILGPEVVVAQIEISRVDLAMSPRVAQPGGASLKRRREFLAGRLAAAEVLRGLGASSTDVRVGDRRAPAWPDGFVGSITHDAELACAAAARAGKVAGIGIDIEQADRFTDSLAERIGSPAEFELWQGYQEHPVNHAGIALFSLKESVFKCLHRAVGKYFDFRDVQVYRSGFALRVSATGDDSRLAELLPRLRGDVRELGGKVISGCVLLGD